MKNHRDLLGAHFIQFTLWQVEDFFTLKFRATGDFAVFGE
ncbi:Uncharacterised protein [Vibrio cholerae]|nr:Uncharacterised protein [Vibrio cholerae]